MSGYDTTARDRARLRIADGDPLPAPDNGGAFWGVWALAAYAFLVSAACLYLLGANSGLRARPRISLTVTPAPVTVVRQGPQIKAGGALPAVGGLGPIDMEVAR